MIKYLYFFCLILATLSLRGESLIRPGDRIAVVGNTFADQLRIHGYLETLLLQRSIEKPISLRNLGWAGDMLTARDRPTNFPSEESTLIAHKTDVIIACFGLGESFEGEDGIENFKKDLQDFIVAHKGKQYNGKSDVRLILISPIAYEDLGSLTPNHEQRNQELLAYTQAMQATGTEMGVPVVDLNEPTTRWMADSDGPKLTTNGIHLNPYGYWCVSQTLADALLPGMSPWRLTVDAKTGEALAMGTRIFDVQASEDTVTFKVDELSWPSGNVPLKGNIHRDLQTKLDILRVHDLKEGVYRLEVDGQPIAVADHKDLAYGIALNNTPAHQALKVFRERVNDKNLQFVYSWKALNQVHIVGERRASKSGQALPGEVIEFNQLAKEMDDSLRHGIELKVREWRLVPVKEFR